MPRSSTLCDRTRWLSSSPSGTLFIIFVEDVTLYACRDVVSALLRSIPKTPRDGCLRGPTFRSGRPDDPHEERVIHSVTCLTQSSLLDDTLVMSRSAESVTRQWSVRSTPIRMLAMILSTAASFACADGPTGPGASSAARIQLDPSTVTAVSLGETIQLTARVLDASGALLSQLPLTWTSSDTTILVSEGNGRFRAKANGNAVATVGLTNDDRLPKQTAQVVVHQEAAQIISTSDTLTLFAIGQTATIQAHVKDALGNDLVGSAAPTWRSADPGVATVDSAGNVTAKGDGEMLITLQAGQLSKSFFTRVSATVRVSGCVSSADVVGRQKCSAVPLTVRR